MVVYCSGNSSYYYLGHGDGSALEATPACLACPLLCVCSCCCLGPLLVPDLGSDGVNGNEDDIGSGGVVFTGAGTVLAVRGGWQHQQLFQVRVLLAGTVLAMRVACNIAMVGSIAIGQEGIPNIVLLPTTVPAFYCCV